MTIALQGGGVNSFSYEETILDDLEASFSPERMSTYLSAVRGDRERALHLYAWNTAVSAAFYGPLQGLEVALRNAMHRQLAGRYGADWYDNSSAGLDAGCLERIAKAQTEVTRIGHMAGPPRVVAALVPGNLEVGAPRPVSMLTRAVSLTPRHPLLQAAPGPADVTAAGQAGEDVARLVGRHPFRARARDEVVQRAVLRAADPDADLPARIAGRAAAAVGSDRRARDR